MLQLLRLNSILKLGGNFASLVKKSITPAKSGGYSPVGTRTNSEKDLCIRRSGAFLEKICVFAVNQKYGALLFFLLFSSLATAASAPPPVKKQASFTEYLTQEKAHLTAAIQDANQPIRLKSEKEFSTKMKQVSAIRSMTSVKIASLESFLDHQYKEQNSLNQRLKLLQQMPIVKENTTIPERVEKVEKLLIINKQTTELVVENLKLAKEFQTTINDEIKHLELWHANFVLEQKLIQIKSLKEQLNKRLNRLYESNSTTQPIKKSKPSTPFTAADYEAMRLISNQNIAAIQNHLHALNIQKTVVKADIIYLKNPDTKNLQLITDIYKDALNQYAKVEKTSDKLEIF